MLASSVTLVGHLARDPDLRITATGAAVVTLRVAATERRFDRSTEAWVDAHTLFITVNAWRDLALNVAESLRRGDRVTVTGRLRQRDWETKEGEKRTTVEVEADSIGADLLRALARPARIRRDALGAVQPAAAGAVEEVGEEVGVPVDAWAAGDPVDLPVPDEAAALVGAAG